MRPAAQKLQDYMADSANKAPPSPHVSVIFSSGPAPLALTRGLGRLGFVQVKFADPSVPIVSNVTARPITQAGELLALEVKQVTDAVQWLDSIRLLAYPATAAASSEGTHTFLYARPHARVLAHRPTRAAPDVMRHAAGRPAWKEIEEEEKLWQWKGFDDFLELGPGKTLSSFVRQIGTELQATYAVYPPPSPSSHHVAPPLILHFLQERGHGARSDRLLQALPRVKKPLCACNVSFLLLRPCCGEWAKNILK